MKIVPQWAKLTVIPIVGVIVTVWLVFDSPAQHLDRKKLVTLSNLNALNNAVKHVIIHPNAVEQIKRLKDATNPQDATRSLINILALNKIDVGNQHNILDGWGNSLRTKVTFTGSRETSEAESIVIWSIGPNNDNESGTSNPELTRIVALPST